MKCQSGNLHGVILFVALVNMLFFWSGCTVAGDIKSPYEIAKKIGDRLVRETIFSFVPAQSKSIQEGAYYIDFFNCFSTSPGSIYYAHSHIIFDSEVWEQEVLVGISHSPGELLIRIDGAEIYRKKSHTPAHVKPLDYDIVKYESVIPIIINNQTSEILIKMIPSGNNEARVYIGFINPDGRQRRDIALSPVTDLGLPQSVSFLAIGPFGALREGIDTIQPPDTADVKPRKPYDGLGGREIFWDLPRIHLISELPHPLDYADWRYFTGTFLDALDEVSRMFPELNYYEYIDEHIDFFLNNYQSIQAERSAYGLLRTPFGHYFRFSLLDDVGMQGVPFIERLYRFQKYSDIDIRETSEWNIVERIADHIMNDALRLEDGTFCRINPDSMTVWADDLFMGTVFLIRLSKLTGDDSYIEEAIKQTLLFDSYLQDIESGLYWHGWFTRNKTPSSSKWARANGWIMMAKTELLHALPDHHPSYEKIISGFRKQAEGIRKIQSKDGRWHQVLDNSETYLETSATAMFVRAFADGIGKGWLTDDVFRGSAERGWYAVTKQVRDDGMVEGIVRGTPIMFSDEEYNNHPTRLNDPRGLGAVLYAAAAMNRLYSNKSK